MGVRFDKTRDIIMTAAVAAALVFIVYVCIFVKDNMMDYGQPEDFSEGWESLADPDNYTLMLSRTITDDMVNKAISFYAYDAYVTVYVGGETVYSFGRQTAVCKSPSSIRHMISIPSDSAGSTLTVFVQCVYPSKYNEELDITIGRPADLMVYYIRHEIPDILINMFLALMGTALIMIFLGERLNGISDRGVLYLGCVCILTCLGSCSDLFLSQLIVKNSLLLYFIYYFVLFTAPLFLLGYLESINERYRCTAVFHSHMTGVAVFIVLHFTGVYEFTETLVWYLILLAVEVLAMIVMVVRVGVHTQVTLRNAFFVMIGCMLINILLYMISPSEGVSMMWSKLGVCVYMFTAIVFYTKQLVKSISDAHHAENLKRQAMTDPLTGLGNRFAFNEEMERADFTKISMVSFDLNNLKYYNDTKGHLYGDMLITRSAEVLSRIYDKVYRTGGDEFIAVEYMCSSMRLEVLKRKLVEKAMRISDKELIIEIACGFSSYTEGDRSYEDILRRADEQMYIHKQELKAHSAIKAVR